MIIKKGRRYNVSHILESDKGSFLFCIGNKKSEFVLNFYYGNKFFSNYHYGKTGIINYIDLRDYLGYKTFELIKGDCFLIEEDEVFSFIDLLDNNQNEYVKKARNLLEFKNRSLGLSQFFIGDSCIEIKEFQHVSFFEMSFFTIKIDRFQSSFLNNYIIVLENGVHEIFTYDLSKAKQYDFGHDDDGVNLFSEILFLVKNDQAFYLLKMPNVEITNVRCLGFINKSNADNNNIDRTLIKGTNLSLFKKTKDSLEYLKFKNDIHLTFLKLKNKGIEIDINHLFENFEGNEHQFFQVKEIIEESISTSEENLDMYGGRVVCFRIRANYSKNYFIAAKLAENAESIEKSDETEEYIIRMKIKNIDNVEMLYQIYFREGSYTAGLECEYYVTSCSFYEVFRKNIYSALLRVGSFKHNYNLSEIMLNILETNRRKTMDILYKMMIKECRVPTKWKSEYRLFKTIKRLIPDAIYQQRFEWLGSQSYDIYLPSQNTAIEYQGKGHFEAIEVFGGQKHFQENIQRDKKKYDLSKQNGVKVLYWNYDRYVRIENVKEFLIENGITDLQEPKLDNEMAPVIDFDKRPSIVKERKKEKIPFEHISDYKIFKYDLDGKFVCEYKSLKEASDSIRVRYTSMVKSASANGVTLGGFQWRKVSLNEKPNDIEPIIKKINTGMPVIVEKYSKTGEFICEYPSLSEASRDVGVSNKCIADAIKGIQKTAGGFVWKKK